MVGKMQLLAPWITMAQWGYISVGLLMRKGAERAWGLGPGLGDLKPWGKSEREEGWGKGQTKAGPVDMWLHYNCFLTQSKQERVHCEIEGTQRKKRRKAASKQGRKKEASTRTWMPSSADLEQAPYYYWTQGRHFWAVKKNELWLLQGSFIYLQQIEETRNSPPNLCLWEGRLSPCWYTLFGKLHVNFFFAVGSCQLILFTAASAK